MNKFLSAVLISLLFASCNSETASVDESDGLSAFNADSLGKHIAVLSADDFTGRKPFTEGETKTINYLKEQFAAAGLEPGNGRKLFPGSSNGQDHHTSISCNAGPIFKRKFFTKGI